MRLHVLDGRELCHVGGARKQLVVRAAVKENPSEVSFERGVLKKHECNSGRGTHFRHVVGGFLLGIGSVHASDPIVPAIKMGFSLSDSSSRSLCRRPKSESTFQRPPGLGRSEV